MPQSLACLIIHVIFSTKYRAPVLGASIRPSLFAYLATCSRNAKCECYRVGGAADHVHLVIRLSRTITVAKLVEELKTASSKWMKRQSNELSEFAWQVGYGAFSVSSTELGFLRRYIDNQERHHRDNSFQDEYVRILVHHGVEYDERLLWD